jgi:hypothetical protein
VAANNNWQRHCWLQNGDNDARYAAHDTMYDTMDMLPHERGCTSLQVNCETEGPTRKQYRPRPVRLVHASLTE